MEHISTRYDPRFLIKFSPTDIFCLKLFSERHYDLECRRQSQLGGMIYGFESRADCDPEKCATVELSWSQVDLLLKCIEHDSTSKLFRDLKSMLDLVKRPPNR